MGSESQIGEVQQEWLDLKALTQYACVSERTLREWIHRPTNPLPAARVGTKHLIRRRAFDQWLEGHQVKTVDINGIVNEMFEGVSKRKALSGARIIP